MTTSFVTSAMVSGVRQRRRTGSARYRGSGARAARPILRRGAAVCDGLCAVRARALLLFSRLCGEMDGLRCHANPGAQRLGARADTATFAPRAAARKCTCQIESRRTPMRKVFLPASQPRLDTYSGRSGRAKSLLSELIWLCGTVRPPFASCRDCGSSADVRNVFQRDGMSQLSRGSDRPVGLPIIPLLPGPTRLFR